VLTTLSGVVAFGVIACGVSSVASAQDFPAKPLRLVIPFGAGGVADTTSRLIAQKMSERLGRPITVENIPTGGAAVAIRAVKEAPADGHTMVMVTNSSTIAVSLFKAHAYDVTADLAAVSLVGAFEFFYVTRADSPYTSLQEFLAAARQGPGKLKIVPNTNGSTQHLSTLMLRSTTGTDFAVAPSANSNELIAAVLRGDGEIGVDAYAVLKNHLVDGRLKAIVSTGARAAPVLNVGTVQAAIGRDFDFIGWNSIYVKAGTSPAVIDRLNDAVRAALRDETIKRSFLDVGIHAEPTTPAGMTALFNDNVAKWAAVIAANGIERQ